jgi:C-terminal processing protease CtpA/Prc
MALVAVALLVAVPALAGSGEKCTADAQSCLTKWAKSKDMAWHGLHYDKGADGTVTVKSVMEKSPATAAGIQVGDVLVALNGAKMADKDAVKKAKGEWKAGQAITLTVSRKGTESAITVTLAKMPEEVFASMVGTHLLENHVAVAATAAATEGEVKAAAPASNK